MSFINDVLNHKSNIEDIDLYLKEYVGDTVYDYNICEYLGLTEFEYEQWLKIGDSYLLEVLYKRKLHKENITRWRKHPEKFIKEVFGIKVKWHHKILLEFIFKNKDDLFYF